jgi:hypothetical protein
MEQVQVKRLRGEGVKRVKKHMCIAHELSSITF